MGMACDGAVVPRRLLPLHYELQRRRLASLSPGLGHTLCWKLWHLTRYACRCMILVELSLAPLPLAWPDSQLVPSVWLPPAKPQLQSRIHFFSIKKGTHYF